MNPGEGRDRILEKELKASERRSEFYNLSFVYLLGNLVKRATTTSLRAHYINHCKFAQKFYLTQIISNVSDLLNIQLSFSFD